MKKPTDAAKPKLARPLTGKPAKVTIRKMPTGVRGLDEILGGGIPEFSFNVIAGMPGCGKTTLAHQIIFANATAKKPALYFTAVGEPAVKMLRYQQQYSFFDESKLGNAVRFIDLAELALEKDLSHVLDAIGKYVAESNPSVVVVDSFHTIVRNPTTQVGELDVPAFILRLAQLLTSWEATTFLIGSYLDDEIGDNSLFTLADGLIFMFIFSDFICVVIYF